MEGNAGSRSITPQAAVLPVFRRLLAALALALLHVFGDAFGDTLRRFLRRITREVRVASGGFQTAMAQELAYHGAVEKVLVL